ncbi:MAG: ABC transporter permease [Micrococcales bacterium]|nr:ABC transporter permease [Micrococcales bacterium]
MSATADLSRVPRSPRSRVDERWSPAQRYRRSLWLLTTRDLKVRYSTSALGWLWSVLDPLLMAAIYWFVFTQVFQRGSVGDRPYIVFLLLGLLPWTWFSAAISDCTKAFTRDAKLIRSTTIPRSIWVARIVLSKGIEFLFSIPVLAVFVIGTQFAATTDERAQVHWELALWPLAILLQAALTFGIGMIVAPLVVFFRDLERAVRLILRLAFYASPIIFSLGDLGRIHPLVQSIAAFNPFAGVITLYRSAFFPAELDWFAVLMSAVLSVVLVAVGLLVFRRTVPAVLKEI